MSTISAELSDLLRSMEYPAQRSDLVREAAREGIRESELVRLSQMTPRSYNGRFDVVTELRWNHLVESRPASLQPSIA